MKKAILILYLLLPTCLIQANWQRSISNHSRHTYKAANQNWMIDQHENGWMYFANNAGLLEFDGRTWNTYPIHNAKMRAVKCGKDGRIYVGGLGQFGYFMPNKFGELEYTCLSDSLETKRATGNIWNISILEDRVCFQADTTMYYIENNTIDKIDCSDGIFISAIINNKFYIVSGRGIHILNGNSFAFIPSTEQTNISKTVGLYPYNDQLLIVTSLNGLYIYDGNETKPFNTVADSFIARNQILCSAMAGSVLALGSVQDGIVLVDLENNQIETISTKNGLQNKTVLSLLFDREYNLWLGLDNGIDCVHLNIPMFFLYSNNSAIGAGYASCYYKNKLYLGTNQGLYETDFPIKLTKDTNLKLIEGTEGQVWSLLEYEGDLFSGGINSLIIFDGNKSRKIKGLRGVWSLLPLKPGMIIAGTYFGIYVIKKEGGEWKLSHRIENAHYPSKNIYVEKLTNAIWFSNKEKGLFRLILSDDLKSAEVKNYNNDSIPISFNTYINKINKEIVIASRQGLFRYNPTKDRLERYHKLENILDGSAAYTYITQDKYENIWYVSDGALKIARYQPEKKSWKRSESESYLKGYLIEDFEYLSVYGENHALIGTEEGVCLLDFSKKTEKKFPMNLQIRKVYLTMGKDSLIYGRSYAYQDLLLTIPYKNNSIKIEYSLNNYAHLNVTQYSYKLDGSGYSEWSEFSETNTKEYSNLSEGKYTFHVKTIINEDMEEVSTSFDFEVLPPWYRSWYAYLFYLLAIISFVIYLYHKFILGQQKTIRKKDQEIIRQREENTKKDQKIVSLKEKNLRSELKYKSDELVKTTLNIVRKNEILQNIKKEAISISRSIDDENLPNIRRKVIRLINSVDTNMEHDDDLQAFETTFDSVHHDFFEKLDQQFPLLNKKEKLLCAYIKMDLMSKEIAPLMNISLRGVEISRYRLRKKLDLSSENNLAEFLQKL